MLLDEAEDIMGHFLAGEVAVCFRVHVEGKGFGPIVAAVETL